MDAKVTVKGRMSVLDPTGHTEITWDSDNEQEVATARAMFTAMTGQGYQAFHPGAGKGDRGGRITSFDPEIEAMVLFPSSGVAEMAEALKVREKTAVYQVLWHAYRLIRPRRHWVQHTFMTMTHIGNSDEEAFCAVGAVRRARIVLGVRLDEEMITDMLDVRVQALRFGKDEDGDNIDTIVALNDQADADKAHREVLRVFAALIKQLKPKPKKKVIKAPPLQPTELHEVVKEKEEELA